MSIKVVNHPLLDHKMALLRSVGTSTKDFRELLGEISTMLMYEALHDLPTIPTVIKTPLARTKGTLVDADRAIFVSILRAGLGMVDGVLSIMPNAKFGHIGMVRNEETLQATEYYFKMPPFKDDTTIYLLDPMLATGGTASDSIVHLKKQGVKKIKLVVVVAAPEGIERIHTDHPEVEIIAAAIDEYINNVGYIVPGLGDAGDRVFGTV